ncbi:MAG TPA: Obg family GTPase CgtA [Candidatus Azosocius sp. HAIN]
MKFVDSAVLFVKGGNGGNGSICFRKDKNNFSVKIPDGGDGGNGGNVHLLSDININTLIDFSFKRFYEAENGNNGKSKNLKGLCGRDIIIKVPFGTQIFDYNTKEFIGDLSNNKLVLVACGGLKGIGNFKFKNKLEKNVYNYSQGGIGEFKILKLELKILSDVALIGLPNSGKSTLIVKISLSKSKISNYPFTTIYPRLGVVFYYYKNFIIADTPGIINNASLGVGLGYNFLKHFLKSKLLLHIVDISSNDILFLNKDINIIRKELLKYDKYFLFKNIWIVLNKSDIISRHKLLYIYKYIYFYYKIPIFIISSLKGYGLKKLCKDISFFLSSNNYI